MRFTMNRTLQYYYVLALVGGVSLFSYGTYHYWKQGPLNVEYVSALYEGTSLVDDVKKRNDVEELKKYVDGDRIKDALNVIERMDGDLKELEKIKAIDEESSFNTNYQKVKASVSSLSTQPELTTILTSVSGKISQFENFVIEKKWPTLSKMATNLRIKTSPSKIISGGLYNFDKTSNLIASINNDLEAMSNFTQSTGLAQDIKMAILNRIQVLKNETVQLDRYVEEHNKFNKIFKDFNGDYQKWFKQVEPEIALRKLEFEKNSQYILFSIAIFVLGGTVAIGFGVWLNSWSDKKNSKHVEKTILNVVQHSLIPAEGKLHDVYSTEFVNEFERYRDFVHKRMTFGSIFQEALPFPGLLLDSNLNLIWANHHFYKTWQLDNFDEKTETLTWDFVQRFTNLDDQSSLMNALRLNHSGIIPIQVRPATSDEGGMPFEMYVSPVEYSGQKRIMIIFYPLNAIEENLKIQKNSIVEPTVMALNAIHNDSFSPELQTKISAELDFAGSKEIFDSLKNVHDIKLRERSELNAEIERLDDLLSKTLNTMSDMRKNLVSNLETQRMSVDKFNQLKNAFGVLLDTRDQLEEQMRMISMSTRELFKDQSKMITTVESSEKMVSDYTKSMKLIADVKSQFKGIRSEVDDFRMRMIQLLDQLLIFQTADSDNTKIEQFLGKMKFEIKSFDRVLNQLAEVGTQMDVQLTKIEMMNESRSVIELQPLKERFDQVKASFENVQFATSKTSQVSHMKDDEMVQALKTLVGNQKADMKRTDELCLLSGMTPEHLKMIAETPHQM